MTHTEESLMALAFRYGDARFDCGMSKEGKEREAAYGRMESTHYALLDAIREVLAERDAATTRANTLDKMFDEMRNRAERAEAEVQRLRGVLRSVEWMTNGKCPICLGLEVIKGQGECYRVHTKTCQLNAALKDQP